MSQTGALSVWELGTLNRSQLILLENADPTFFWLEDFQHFPAGQSVLPDGQSIIIS